MSKRKYKVTFVDQWLEGDGFKSWLQKVEDIYSAQCSICCKMFDISSMCGSELTSHMKGKETLNWYQQFLDPRTVILEKVKVQIYQLLLRP